VRQAVHEIREEDGRLLVRVADQGGPRPGEPS
jgi:hypothetical protein